MITELATTSQRPSVISLWISRIVRSELANEKVDVLNYFNIKSLLESVVE